MAETLRRVALVTGATGGIGKAMAEALASDGIDIVVTGREPLAVRRIATELRSRFDVKVYPIIVDLAEEGGPERLFMQVASRGIELDYLINNAGVGVFGTFEQSLLADEVAMLRLNVLAPTILCKLFLPQLARRRGRVMNVASVAAFQPGPFMAVYYASKAYVLSFTEALATEWEGRGVTFTTFCPGPTRSGFQARAVMEHSRLVRGKLLADADGVGRAGVIAMMEGRRVAIPGLANRLTAIAVKWLPRRWVSRAVMKMSAPDSTSLPVEAGT